MIRVGSIKMVIPVNRMDLSEGQAGYCIIGDNNNLWTSLNLEDINLAALSGIISDGAGDVKDSRRCCIISAQKLCAPCQYGWFLHRKTFITYFQKIAPARLFSELQVL